MVDYHNSPRDIFSVTELIAKLRVIGSYEEDKFSDVPKWDGNVLSWTDRAVLFSFPGTDRPSRENWFPLSTLRKAEDEQSIYASKWILDKKGL